MNNVLGHWVFFLFRGHVIFSFHHTAVSVSMMAIAIDSTRELPDYFRHLQTTAVKDTSGSLFHYNSVGDQYQGLVNMNGTYY